MKIYLFVSGAAAIKMNLTKTSISPVSYRMNSTTLSHYQVLLSQVNRKFKA